MNANDELLHAVPTDDGLLLFGSADMLQAIDTVAELPTRELGSKAMSKASQIFGAAAQLQASNGRWVKLDQKSAAWLKEHGISTVSSGTVRGKDLGKAVGKGTTGSIAKHLDFEKAGLLTPAAPEVAAVLAAQAAIEMAISEIVDYLEEIDSKLDKLLRQRKIDIESTLVGVRESILEAQYIQEATGRLSAVSFAKIEDNSSHLLTVQAIAIGQIRDNAIELEKLHGNPDKLVRAVRVAEEDTRFWLQILAHALLLQDQQYVLELARVADDTPEQVEAHTTGIRTARTQRMERIENELTRLLDSINKSVEMPNLRRVVNPIDAPRIVKAGNAVRSDVDRFARNVGLENLSGGELRATGWADAARGLAVGTAKGAQKAGQEGASAVIGVGRRLRRRTDDSVLRMARRIEERRSATTVDPTGSDPKTTETDADPVQREDRDS